VRARSNRDEALRDEALPVLGPLHGWPEPRRVRRKGVSGLQKAGLALDGKDRGVVAVPGLAGEAEERGGSETSDARRG
jgi:hypothetical protein